MNRQRSIAIGFLLLGAAIIASAMLGPLGTGMITFRISPTMEHQLIGGEIASLLLALPATVTAGALWWRGHRLAPLVAIGPAVFAAYIYAQYIIGPEYSRYPGNNERAFPLYAAIVAFGWVLAVCAWSELGRQHLPRMTHRLRRALGGLLIGGNLLFLLAWLQSIAAVYSGSPTIEYERDPQLFWLIRLMDLSVLIPIGLTVGVGLLRNATWAHRAGYAMAGVETLIIAAVAGMAVRMEVMNDPSSDPVLLVATVVLTAVYLGIVARLLWTTWHEPRPS